MMTAANPLVEEEAKKIVDRFVRRFDESYRLLVYHAAIPLILTPELLNYLRHQFLRGQVSWVAEVDLLLSDLFNPVGYELYAMDAAVRAYLLGNIEDFFHKQGLDEKHLQEVALVLLGYVKYLARTNSFFRAPELQAQQWAAMVCLEDKKEQVFQEIKKALQNCGSEAELERLTQITQELSPRLSNYPSLIKFAESVRDLLLDLKPGLTETTKQIITKVSQDLEIDVSKFPQLGIREVRSNGLHQILLVEDELEVIAVIREVLSSEYGIAVEGTDEVNEVIKLAESGQIDLILINHRLPNSRYQGTKVNGLEIIRILRANPNISSSLPIVGFSQDYRVVANDFLESGANGFYSKEELLETKNYQKFVDYLQEIFNRRKNFNYNLQPLDVLVAKITFDDEPETPQQLEFKTVTVNSSGQEIKTETHRASYYEQSLGDNIPPLVMMGIPEGEFIMGSPKTEPQRYDSESPQHQVQVASFWLAQTPITNAQWNFVANLPQIQRELNSKDSNNENDHPVTYVNWYDAIEFCARLSHHTGRDYRLSSEAEWEYACRAGTTTPFHFGDTITSELANYAGDETYAEEPAGEYREKTVPVKSFSPNAFGLYDMHGQVWEWCADPWHDDYRDAPGDSQVWDEGNDNDNYYQNIPDNLADLLKDDRRRVQRGGSWDYSPWFCRSAYRSWYDPDFTFDNYGFRVACGGART